MRFKHTLLNLALLLATASMVFSCITVDKSLGEQYIPKDHEVYVKSAVFKLPVTTRMVDSLQGISGDYAAVGAIRTKEFGLATFATCANICPATSLNFGKDPVIKSIYFTAAIGNASVTEENQQSIPQDFFVYRLNKRLDSTTLYCNSITLKDCQPSPLNLSSATFFGKDSVKIYLNNAYGTELLSATQEELDSTDLFINRFKGIYITCNTPEGGLIGGRVNDFSYSSAALILKYNFQPTWADGLERKDTTVYLNFGDGYCLNTSKYDSEHLVSNEPQETLPIEGVAGVKPYIDGKALKSMLDAWAAENKYNPKNIIVAKAIFSFPFEIPADLDMSNYPSYLFPTYRNTKQDDTLKQYYYPVLDVNSSGNSLGVLNRSLSEYSGSFSSTIQKMINTEASKLGPKYNLWMAPIYSMEDPYYGTISYVLDTYSYSVGNINGPKAARYPTLTLVYSVISD